MQNIVEIAPAGKISSGRTDLSFELPLKPKANRTLYETYHGVYVNVQYTLRCDIKRNFLAKDISKSLEFMVEDRNVKTNCINKPVLFKISPTSVQNNRERSSTHKFLITGKIDSLQCKLSEPLTGEVVVQNTETSIKSIELQLVRVETCGCTEGYSKEGEIVFNLYDISNNSE